MPACRAALRSLQELLAPSSNLQVATLEACQDIGQQQRVKLTLWFSIARVNAAGAKRQSAGGIETIDVGISIQQPLDIDFVQKTATVNATPVNVCSATANVVGVPLVLSPTALATTT